MGARMPCSTALQEVYALLTEAALLLVLKSGRPGRVEVRDNVHAELDARDDRGLGTLHRAVVTQS